MSVTYSVCICYNTVSKCLFFGSDNDELNNTVLYKLRVTIVLELRAKMKTLHNACLTFVPPSGAMMDWECSEDGETRCTLCK
jgi:hypothetical protein